MNGSDSAHELCDSPGDAQHRTLPIREDLMTRRKRPRRSAPKAPNRNSPTLIAIAVVLAIGATILIALALTR